MKLADLTVFNGLITVNERKADFLAYFTFDSKKQGTGKTAEEALGKLLITHQNELCHLLKAWEKRNIYGQD